LADAMTTLELARLQFGITTTFHFIFVPLTIGLAFFTALCQTRWHRTGDETWLRMTRFWGKLMLISFAVGVVTGIVQEFQFGMNWSEYSRYVGDIFGAPLAIEGLAAFFIESTFLGLWLFGWGRLSPKVHLATIWLVSIGTLASAYFILAANSWMQHPVGYEVNEAAGRAEMTNVLEVLTNPTTLYAFPHTILGALSTGGMVILAVCAYHLLRKREVDLFRRSASMALPIVLAATVATAVVGHFSGVHLTEVQPMKMAAAEAQWETEKGAGLSLFAIGDLTRNPGGTDVNIEVPKLLSVIAHNDPDAVVRGINDVQAEYEQTYGPGDYVPIVGVTYWSFRIMIGAGLLMIALAALGLWLTRKERLESSPRFLKLLLPAAALPFIANTAGWVFTEMGRQPWVVQGLLSTEQGVSPGVSSAEVILTLVGFTVIYGVLAAVGGRLFFRFAKAGPPSAPTAPADQAGESRPDLALAY